jgi:formate dehydrogenase subunit gamma
MEQRTVERFRRRVILIHWVNAASFAVLLITGALMFFDLTSFSGGHQIRTIHRVASVFFVIVPILYSVFDPPAVISFLKEAFRWDRDGLAWLKASVPFYFGRKVQMPPQGFINGDQKLWQLVVIVTALGFTLTGMMLWFFKLKIPLVLYQWLLLTHTTAFVVVSFMFIVHFYLRTLHPSFEESLSSMLDGKISSPYAREHYGKWYTGKTGAE